jgi:HD superfamily phosphohydrolase YqeK
MLDAADSLARRHQAAADDAAALLASLSHDIFTRLEQEARRESA